MKPWEAKRLGTSVFPKRSWYVGPGGRVAVLVSRRPDRGLRPGLANSSPGSAGVPPAQSRLRARDLPKGGLGAHCKGVAVDG